MIFPTNNFADNIFFCTFVPEYQQESKMEEKGKIVFNISGGTQQILPNATKAEQNFYFNSDGKEYMPEVASQSKTTEDAESEDVSADEGASATGCTDDAESSFALYIYNKEHVKEYIASLRNCFFACEVGKVVAQMVSNNDIFEETAKKEMFISRLLPFLDKVRTGRTIGNLRKTIHKGLDLLNIGKK
jgi:negative regulator of genetic competence, sporulation and motility